MATENLDIVVKVKDEATSSLESMLTSFVSVTAGVTALTSVFIKAIDAVSEFESGMANVATLLDEEGRKALQGMEDDLQNLAVITGTSLSQLTEGLYYVVSAGIDAEEQMEFLTVANKLAVAGNTDLATSIQAMVGYMKAYGDESLESAAIADLLFAINKKGFTTFEEIASAINKATTFANLANVSQQELAATMATLVGSTGTASEVITQLNAVFKSLVAPSSEMAEAIRNVGYESGNAMVEALGFQGTLEALYAQTGDNEIAFQNLFTEAEAIKGVMPLVGAQAEILTENLVEVSNATGLVDEAFTVVQKTFDRQSAQLKEGVNVAFLQLGTMILPALILAVQNLSAFLQQNQTTVENLSTVLSFIFYVAIEAVIFIVEKLNVLMDSFNATVEVIQTNIEVFSFAFQQAWGDIDQYVMPIINKIQDAIETIISAVSSAISALSSLARMSSVSAPSRAGLGLAEGGLVYAAGGFSSRGTDTVPAMLTPGELVLNKAQQKAIAGGMGGVTININGNYILNDDDVMEKIGDPLVRELKKHFSVATTV